MAILLLGASAAATAQQADAKAGAAAADTATSAKPAAPQAAMATVEVKGDYDPRSEDTASKTVLSHQEIMKYGDTNVYDVLKRAPGVTVVGNSIRMRGLGNGYTQVLVNGERPPPGFSIDNLTPDQIEKIEVVRAATAEHSMQAIAGSINIVLSKVVAKAQRDLRMNVNHTAYQDNQFVIGTLADRSGALSYYLNAMMYRNVSNTPGYSTDQLTTPDGQVTQLRDSVSHRIWRNRGLGMQPRLNWKMANDDQLNVSGFVQVGRSSGSGDTAYTDRIGVFSVPDYVSRHNDDDNHSHFVGGDVNWIAKLWGGKLDAKAGLATGSNDGNGRSLSSSADGALHLRRDNDTGTTFKHYNSSGKYARTLFEGHALAAGWEVSRQQFTNDIVRVEGLLGAEPARIAENFTPRVTKLAAYAQDEWNLTKQWSVYLGARWEGIRTDSSGTGLLDTESRSHVLSPVAQTLYKFPDKSGRQLRLALTRTYKAPDPNDLSARRSYADVNTRFNPDWRGNPNLRPELATGVDLAYERFWSTGAMYSVSASARHITDYMRRMLVQDSGGYWLNEPVNDGSAQVRSLDFELKFPLKAVLKDAPPLDLRANLSRNWSQVATVPGPNNRLDQQVPLTAVLGADYKADQFSTGASFSYRGGGPVRISEQQSAYLQLHRELEAYLLYKLGKGVQLRVTGSNLLGEDNRGYSRYQDAKGSSESWSLNPSGRRVQLSLELKL